MGLEALAIRICVYVYAPCTNTYICVYIHGIPTLAPLWASLGAQVVGCLRGGEAAGAAADHLSCNILETWRIKMQNLCDSCFEMKGRIFLETCSEVCRGMCVHVCECMYARMYVYIYLYP